MRGLVAVIVVVAVNALWTGESQALPGAIESQYIVVFKETVVASARHSHFRHFSSNLTIIARHSIGKFKAYTAKIAESALPLVMKSADVAYVEQDSVPVIMQSCATQTGLPAGLWGLQRINSRALDLNGQYNYFQTTETPVRAYVLDTGIRETRVEFEGRAIVGPNFVDSVIPDRNGHGTHVASTIGGRTYGVAKTATLIAVKVIGSGSQSWTSVIRGIQWVAEDAAKYRGVSPCIGNMSIGGNRNQAVNDAVEAASGLGVAWIVASGNSNMDACTMSPASAPWALAVGGTTNVDARASFSNFGPCQAVWAPGMSILGAWITSDTASNTVSGTSMSSPHACGAVADILARRPANPPTSPAEAFSILRSSATVGAIRDGKDAQGTPNLLVYSRCSSD